jgi:hypothetical protein
MRQCTFYYISVKEGQKSEWKMVIAEIDMKLSV